MDLDRIARNTLAAQQQAIGDEDAVQDGFVRLARRRNSTIDNPAGYWHQAARRSLIDRARRAGAEARATEAWLSDQRTTRTALGDPEAELLATAEETELRASLAELRRAALSLVGQRRHLIELELAGVTNAGAIANYLGSNAGAVRVLRHRTYAQLRRLIAANGSEAA